MIKMHITRMLLTLVALLTGAATVWADVTGQAPEAGQTYYLYNVGQQQYLANDGTGQLTLSSSATMAVTLSKDANVSETPTFYNMTTQYGQIVSSTMQAPRCDGNGTFNQWQFTEVEGKENVYYLSNRIRALNTNRYLLYSQMLGTLISLPYKPATSFTNAQWMLVSASEVTKTLVLDEASETNALPTDGDSYDVTLKRTFNTGNWNTFCVPFAISDLTVFGSDTKLAEYTSVADGTIYFKTATQIVAGRPYIIKPTTAKTEWTFAGISSFEASPVDVSYYNQTYNCDVVLKGSFVKTMAPEGAYVVSEGKLYHLTGGNKEMKGFRAYFQESDPSSSARINAIAVDGEATGIKSIEADANEGAFDVYNVSGQMVRHAATSLSDLPKGVYIVNGKKVTK